MITVEGLGGKGEVWASWQVPLFDTSTGRPVSSIAHCNATEVVSPVIPSAFYLPPVSAGPFSVLDSPYGGRRTRVDVGVLNGVEGDQVTPNPCDQTTVSGTCICLGPGLDGNPVPRIQINQDPYGGIRYHTNGMRISFLSGKVFTVQNWKAYDHKGVLVVPPLTSETQEMWNKVVSLYPDCTPELVYSPTRPWARVTHGQYWWTKMPSNSMTVPTTSNRHTWRHVSANVWLEEWWQCYHNNAGYIPESPLAPSGFGFVNDYVHRKRTHTLNFIWQKAKGFFLGYFTCDEVTDWWGHTPIYPKATFYSGGPSTGTTTYVATLLVMYPGLCGTGSVDVSKLDNYCQLAIPRAKALYNDSDMGTARSNAVADVTGLDSNWIENLAQAGGTLDCIKPLIDGWIAVRRGDPMAAKRALAGAYLVYKYSIAPTIKDVGDIHDNLGKTVTGFQKHRLSSERRRGACHKTSPVLETTANLSYYCTLHLQLKDNAFAAVWNALEKMGLDPSMRNLWDLVPYSFVIDWFTGIGPALNRLSLYNSATLIRDCKSRIQSYKVQWPISESECVSLLPATLQACGPLTYSWYDRRISDRIGAINPFAGQSFDGLSVSQTTQGLALLSNYIR